MTAGIRNRIVWWPIYYNPIAFNVIANVLFGTTHIIIWNGYQNVLFSRLGFSMVKFQPDDLNFYGKKNRLPKVSRN